MLWSAPVKAPRMWPKSSDSSSVSGTAPQLSATNGLSRRSELKWIARATISLPVPDSPVMSTVLLVFGDGLDHPEQRQHHRRCGR